MLTQCQQRFTKFLTVPTDAMLPVFVGTTIHLFETVPA